MCPFSWRCQNLCLLSLVFIIDWRVVNSNGSDHICETPYSKHEKHKHLDVGGASSSSTLPTASTSSVKKAEKHKKEKKAKKEKKKKSKKEKKSKKSKKAGFYLCNSLTKTGSIKRHPQALTFLLLCKQGFSAQMPPSSL